MSPCSPCGRVMMMAVVIGSSNAFMPLRNFLLPNAAFCNTHAAPHRCLPAFRFLSIPSSPSCTPSPLLPRLNTFCSYFPLFRICIHKIFLTLFHAAIREAQNNLACAQCPRRASKCKKILMTQRRCGRCSEHIIEGRGWEGTLRGLLSCA